MRRLTFALALAILPASTLAAPFGNWTEQRFSLFSGNTWTQTADQVSVASDDAVSLLWTALPGTVWGTKAASWQWAVNQSVPPTDLARKGGDDRNLSLYFIFMPEAVARANQGAGIRRLLKVEEARVLMYVWGGAGAAGTVLPSPYLGPRGRTVVLRQAGTGSHSESVDLARDYTRAFGGTVTSLVGLALSADSDDTNTAIRARIGGLTLR